MTNGASSNLLNTVIYSVRYIKDELIFFFLKGDMDNFLLLDQYVSLSCLTVLFCWLPVWHN